MSREQNFWSRRREGVAAEAKEQAAELEAKVIADEHAVLEEKTDSEILEELKLPDPSLLKMGDDFSVFMARAVPERIRRRALRVLWRSNPVLANLDNLIDYGEDFTDAGGDGIVQTSYLVGKGMLRHVQEMERQAQLLEDAANQEEPLDEPEVIDEEIEEEVVLVAEAEGDDNIETSFGEPQEALAYTTPTPRRMKFRQEERAI